MKKASSLPVRDASGYPGGISKHKACRVAPESALISRTNLVPGHASGSGDERIKQKPGRGATEAHSDAGCRPVKGSVSGGQEEERGTAAFFKYEGAKIYGRAASMGTAIGLAVMVRGREDLARLGEGTVIVSETASPYLATVMSKACAMITEYGGVTAAACGYAREHGIPAVVGVAGLTGVIRDGDLLRVDGTTGVVQLLVPNG